MAQKTLTEKDLKQLSEEELNKVSGGYRAGDICPKCGKQTLVDHRYLNYVICPGCDFCEGDSRSR